MIVSDNGTNFIGARNELNELGVLLKDKEYSTKMSNELGKYNIEWRLNPAHAPHFGGLWESAVNATKYYLRRIISEQKMTFDELYTLQIESCLNSRPITSLSSNPDDLNPLTPGYFLIGDALTAIPENDLREIKINRLGRYQLIQQMFQHFWQRWNKKYLQQLQQRNKWYKSIGAIRENDLVIIREENLPPLQ